MDFGVFNACQYQEPHQVLLTDFSNITMGIVELKLQYPAGDSRGHQGHDALQQDSSRRPAKLPTQPEWGCQPGR